MSAAWFAIVVALFLSCFPFVLRTLQSWLFERRCARVRTFDHSGFDRAVALLRYTGKTLAASADGVAIPCGSYPGRAVEMFVYQGCSSLFERGVSVRRVTFAKQRWAYQYGFHVPVGVSKSKVARVLECAGLDPQENYDHPGYVMVTARCDLLLVRDDGDFKELNRELVKWAHERFDRALDAVMEYAQC